MGPDPLPEVVGGASDSADVTAPVDRDDRDVVGTDGDDGAVAATVRSTDDGVAGTSVGKVRVDGVLVDGVLVDGVRVDGVRVDGVLVDGDRADDVTSPASAGMPVLTGSGPPQAATTVVSRTRPARHLTRP